MTRLTWDIPPSHFSAGLDRGVYYLDGGAGRVWNGLVSVEERASGTSRPTRYLDGVKIRRDHHLEERSGTIEAFTYPEEFDNTVLHPRRSKAFDLTYRVTTSDSYKIHLLYNVKLAPAGYSYARNEADPFVWEFSTLPVPIVDLRPTSHLIIEAATAYSWTLEALEDVLYGSASGGASMPTPDEVLTIFEENSILQIIDNGDGTWTAIGPDEAVSMIDADTFQIDWPSVTILTSEYFSVHSL